MCKLQCNELVIMNSKINTAKDLDLSDSTKVNKPVSLSYATIARSSYTNDYLIKFCDKYNLSSSDLEYLLDLRDQYKSQMQTIGRILDNNILLHDVAKIFEIRESIAGLTISDLLKIVDNFDCYPICTDTLINNISDISNCLRVIDEGKTYNYLYLNYIIDVFIEYKERTGINNIGDLIDYIERDFAVNHLSNDIGSIIDELSEL